MIDKNFLAQVVANKLDLVTNAEFAVQRAVLLRTREKLVILTKRVVELEEKLGTATIL